MTYLRRHGEIFLILLVLIFGGLWGLSRIFPPYSLAQKCLLVISLLLWIVGLAYCLFRSEFPFFKKHGPAVGMVLLIAYVTVLALGTVSEIFDLGWFSWL